MREVEFNLLEEPWIRVLKPDCTVQEVSLTDALLHAQDYTDLAGEMPTQDAAVLRLLLAVLHAAFSQTDAREQTTSNSVSEAEALQRWKSIWQMQRFMEQPIRDYLARWRERFWLFHPERPFWQVPQAAVGTNYDAAKLIGEISQSGHKLRLFPSYAMTGQTEMSYAQAARWLLYINGYDDTSSKPKAKGLPSPGAGWLGRLGFIEALGKNLFETLMLNWVLLQDGHSPWGRERPCWELDSPRSRERTEIAQPDNQAELLTLQSRRLLLRREDSKVVGYALLGGDFFDRENAFCEQMTTWRASQEKKNAPIVYLPKRHDPAKQFWREFPTIFIQQDHTRLPGIVRWITKLQNPKNGCLDRKTVVRFRIAGIAYGDKDFFVTDAFSDELSFHAALLDDLGKRWRTYIAEEIQRCEKLANAIGHLAEDLAIAAGNSSKILPVDAREQFYFQIDQPFRQWLYTIDPEREEEAEASILAWQEQVQKIARTLGKRMAEQAGPAAFCGREIKKQGKKGKKDASEKIFYSTPKAYQSFCKTIQSIYQDKGGA